MERQNGPSTFSEIWAIFWENTCQFFKNCSTPLIREGRVMIQKHRNNTNFIWQYCVNIKNMKCFLYIVYRSLLFILFISPYKVQVCRKKYCIALVLDLFKIFCMKCNFMVSLIFQSGNSSASNSQIWKNGTPPLFVGTCILGWDSWDLELKHVKISISNFIESPKFWIYWDFWDNHRYICGWWRPSILVPDN